MKKKVNSEGEKENNEWKEKIEKGKIKYIKSKKTLKRSNYFNKRKDEWIEEFKGIFYRYENEASSEDVIWRKKESRGG